MIETYLKQIQALIVENQTVKSENRKLRQMCAQVIAEITSIFEECLPGIPSLGETTLEEAIKSVGPHYRQHLMKARMELKMKLFDFISNYEFESYDDMESVTLDNWDQFFEITKSSKNSLKFRLTSALEEKQEQEKKNSKLVADLHSMDLHITRLNLNLSEKDTMVQKLTDQIAVLKIQNSSLEKQFLKAKSRYEILSEDYRTIEAELNSLITANVELRRELLKSSRQRETLEYQI